MDKEVILRSLEGPKGDYEEPLDNSLYRGGTPVIGVKADNELIFGFYWNILGQEGDYFYLGEFKRLQGTPFGKIVGYKVVRSFPLITDGFVSPDFSSDSVRGAFEREYAGFKGIVEHVTGSGNVYLARGVSVDPSVIALRFLATLDKKLDH